MSEVKAAGAWGGAGEVIKPYKCAPGPPHPPTATVGWHTTRGAPPIGRPDYGPGGEPEIPSKKSPHSSVLVGGVRQRRSCALK